VTDEDEMMLISNKGTLVRARAADVSIIGRNTQGVTLINIADDEKLVSVAKIAESEEEDSEDDVQSEDDSSSEVISKPKENSQSEE
jgi:DNA gyrase subunit A